MPCFRRHEPGAVFETDDFVKERLGGATVERLKGEATERKDAKGNKRKA